MGVINAFKSVASFLDRRPPEVTAALRGAGLKLQLFIDVHMDQNQMELEIPPELMAACARHSLGIHLISNDISAAEVLAARQT